MTGLRLHDATFKIPPDVVKPEPIRFSFNAPDDRKTAVDRIFLDWVNIRYPSRIDAENIEYYTFNNDLVAGGKTTDTLHVYGLPAGASIFDPGDRHCCGN